MEYILGLLTGVVFLVTLGLAVYIGYKLGQRNKPVASVPIDEKEQQRIKAFNEGFQKLFQYDVETALQRKKVTDGE